LAATAVELTFSGGYFDVVLLAPAVDERGLAFPIEANIAAARA